MYNCLKHLFHFFYKVSGSKTTSNLWLKLQLTPLLAMASSSTDSRPAKFARLESLRRKSPYVSQSALAGIIADIRDNGLPDNTSRASMQRATKFSLEQHDQYGPLLEKLQLPNSKGGSTTVYVTNVATYLAALYRSDSYRDLLLRAYALHPCSYQKPWGLCIYSDEIVPGNVLGPASRKHWGVYANFLQNSLEDLGNELSWMVLCCARTSLVNEVEGAMSHLMAAIVKNIFCREDYDPALGILLPSPAPGLPPLRLFFSFQMVLQDGASQKATWCSRGDAALKYCLLCDVRTQPKHERDEDDDAAVAHVYNLEDMRIFSSDEILGSYDRLAIKESTLNKEDFLNWQKACGLTWQKNMFCLDKTLRSKNLVRPKEQYAHDWMHCCVSNGTFQMVLFWLFQSLGKESWKLFEDYLKHWHLPKHLKVSKLEALFSPKKVTSYKKQGKFSCQASEALTLIPILSFWLKAIFLKDAQLRPFCEAFLWCMDVILLLSEGQKSCLTTKQNLQAAVAKCFAGMVSAGWHKNMPPKFHWQWHFGDELAHHGKCIACFATERKHKVLKKYSAARENTQSFELSCMKEILAEELATLMEPGHFLLGPALIKGHPPTKKLAAFLTKTFECDDGHVFSSAAAKLLAGKAYKGDVVLLKSLQGEPEAGQVWAFIEAPGFLGCLVNMFKLKQYNPSTGSAVWEDTSQRALVQLEDVVAPMIYCLLAEGIRTLLPWHWDKQKST